VNAIENFSSLLKGLLEAQEPGDGSGATVCCWKLHQRGCLICLQEASPVSALVWRGMIRWTFYWYCRHGISWRLLSSGLWHVPSGRRVLMYQRFLTN